MICGFDISTTCIGISIFNEDGVLDGLSHLKMVLGKDVDSDYGYLEKAMLFKEYLLKMKDKYEVTDIIVESPLENSNNLNTVRILARFNGICCFLIYDVFGFYPKMITVNESRKLFCKEFTIKKTIKEKNPLFYKALKNIGYNPKLHKDFKVWAAKLDESLGLKPHIEVEKTIFSPTKDLDIKEYIWQKVSKAETGIVWIYNKKGFLESENFDMSDAYVVGKSGMELYGLKK